MDSPNRDAVGGPPTEGANVSEVRATVRFSGSGQSSLLGVSGERTGTVAARAEAESRASGVSVNFYGRFLEIRSCWCCHREVEIKYRRLKSGESDYRLKLERKGRLIQLYEYVPRKWFWRHWRHLFFRYSDMNWPFFVCHECFSKGRTKYLPAFWRRGPRINIFGKDEEFAKEYRYHTTITLAAMKYYLSSRASQIESEAYRFRKRLVKELIARVREDQAKAREARSAEREIEWKHQEELRKAFNAQREVRRAQLQEVKSCRRSLQKLAKALRTSDREALPSLIEEFKQFQSSPTS